MKPDDDPKLILDDAEWRQYKRSTRSLRHWRRLERLEEEVHTDWFAAVERDDQTDSVAVEIEPRLAEEAKRRQVELAGTRPNTQPNDLPQIFAEGKGEAREQAAALTGTNPRYVSDAKKLSKQAP